MTMPSRMYYEALDATKLFHSRNKTFSGRFLWHYRDDLERIIAEYGCKTMLDYGCGKGRQWSEPDEEGNFLDKILGVEVTKYDPAWPPFAEEPQGAFDIVVCTQVLGSVPTLDLPWVVGRLYGFAEKVVYVGERLGPVKKKIHEGIKEHMPHEWSHEQWADALRHSSKKHVDCYLRTRSRMEDNVGTALEKL